MLKVINLYVIKKIFEEPQVKLSPITQMIYINCLMNHFDDKKATIANAVAFDLLDTDFDFAKFKDNFHQLHKAGLVSIHGSKITFNNCWGQHIDRSLLSDKEPSDYTGSINMFPAKHFEQDLLEDRYTWETIQTKHKIPAQRIPNLVALFIKEQTACEERYFNRGKCIRHFISWCGKQAVGITQNVSKSGGKLLE